MNKVPPIAETISQGGRAGSVETAEEGFNLHFKEPSAANPQGLTPEHLFGAAWAACFNSAIKHFAKESGHADEGITVTARVQQSDGPRPFKVDFAVSIPGLDEAKAQKVVNKAHELCPYAKATKGQIDVVISLD